MFSSTWYGNSWASRVPHTLLNLGQTTKAIWFQNQGGKVEGKKRAEPGVIA